MNANLKIADQFRRKAAELAKSLNFNFFGDNKQAPTTFDTPQVSAIGQTIIPAPLFDVKQIEIFNGQVDQFGNKIKELPNTIKATTCKKVVA